MLKCYILQLSRSIDINMTDMTSEDVEIFEQYMRYGIWNLNEGQRYSLVQKQMPNGIRIPQEIAKQIWEEIEQMSMRYTRFHEGKR